MHPPKLTALLAASLSHVQALALNTPTILNERTGKVIAQVHSREIENGTLSFWSADSAVESLADVDWNDGWDEANGEWGPDGEWFQFNETLTTTTPNTNAAVKRAGCDGVTQNIYCGKDEDRADFNSCHVLVYFILQQHPSAIMPNGVQGVRFGGNGGRSTCWITVRDNLQGLRFGQLLAPAQNVFGTCNKNYGIAGFAEGVVYGSICSSQCMANRPLCDYGH